MSKSHLLEIDSVMIDFKGRSILSDVSLRCHTGQIVGLLGSNGSGKSTLLKIIFGIQHTYNKNIRVDGKVYQKPYLENNLIGYLPQNGFLPANLSLKKIVKQYVKGKKMKDDILGHSCFKYHHSSKVKYLSGGERRLFEVMFLLGQNYKFILLDEPFSGIEPKYREAIIELLNEHKADKGFIITDHYYRAILKASNELFLLHEGRIIGIKEWKELENYQYVPAGTFSEQKSLAIDNTVPFEVDNQTLKDLEIIDKGHSGLIMQLFSVAQSKGGNKLIRAWLNQPTNNLQKLTRRRDAIDFFMRNDASFDIPIKQIDFIHHYLEAGLSVIADHPVDVVLWSVKARVKDTNDNFLIKHGVTSVMYLVERLNSLADQLKRKQVPEELNRIVFEVKNLVQNPVFYKKGHNYSLSDIIRIHNYFSLRGREQVEQIMNLFYEVDALQAIAKVSLERNLNFAEYLEADEMYYEANGLFHPLVKQAVPNSFIMEKDSHLCFLTGANMSGKSTFLKSIALSVYLAHVGFPVPALSLKISLLNGLLTTINLTDDLSMGYSHFYSEVKRVKMAVEKIKNQKRMLVIFDELFRGTNVKDAFDASLMITSELATISDTFFMVSTHIVEIADELKKHNSIQFNCFETLWENEAPKYNYQITKGVSKERLGLYIVQKEGIFELLKD